MILRPVLPRLRFVWLLLFCCLGSSGHPVPAAAQTVNITPNPVNLAGNPGDPAFTVQTALENAGANPTLFITGSTVNVAGAGIVTNNAQFLANAPASLAPGATAGPFNAFTVTLTGAATPGVYAGTFTILGGTNIGELNNIGSYNFTVTVLGGGGGGGSAVPEGQAWQLFALAAPALYLARRSSRPYGVTEAGNGTGMGTGVATGAERDEAWVAGGRA